MSDFKPNPHDTHWMPPPPSPEEMAAARSLPDYRAPEHGGLHASALPSVKWNLAPEEMAARPTLEEEERLGRIRQLAKQTADEIEHYEKLCKLEQLLRKRIKLYKDSPLDHPNDLQMNWRVQEEIYATLCGFLKEAGLE